MKTTRFSPEEYRSRPKDFDPAVADRMIDMIANGEDLESLCRNNRDLPLPGTFLRWMQQDGSLALAYDEAKRIRAEILFEEIVPISDSSDSNRSRVQIDARKFNVQQTSPDKYGKVPAMTGPRQEDSLPDYAAEVRRKLDAMVKRLGDKQVAAA